MKNTSLVEGLYGHGGIKHSKIRHKIKRICRPWLGMASQPYNWSNPIPDPNYPVKNQGINFSCGRQAGAYAQRTLLAKIGTDPGEISARSGYAKYCARGGGMTMDAVERSICVYGANTEAVMPSYYVPNVTPLSPLSEAAMETNIETPQTIADALTRAGFTPVSVHIDKDSMAQAIRDYGCVIMLVQGQNGNQPANWTTAMPSPPLKSNKDPLWEHYMYAPFTTTTAIGSYNSWGTSVGKNGRQFFDETYINSGHILDCVAFLSDKEIVALPSSMIGWSAFLSWFKRLFASQSS